MQIATVAQERKLFVRLLFCMAALRISAKVIRLFAGRSAAPEVNRAAAHSEYRTGSLCSVRPTQNIHAIRLHSISRSPFPQTRRPQTAPPIKRRTHSSRIPIPACQGNVVAKNCRPFHSQERARIASPGETQFRKRPALGPDNSAGSTRRLSQAGSDRSFFSSHLCRKPLLRCD